MVSTEKCTMWVFPQLFYFPLQKWLREAAPILHYTYIASRVHFVEANNHSVISSVS